MIKYFNDVNTVYDRSTFYLPRRLYDNENLFNDIIKFVSNNKKTLTNIAGIAGSVADTVNKIGTTAFDVIKKAGELKNKAPITDDEVNKVFNAKDK